MTVEADIYTRIKAVSGITDLIGTGDNCRAYPGMVPQTETNPCLSFERVGAQRAPMMGADSGVVWARFQFNCFADDYDGARNLCNAVRAGLQRYGGTGTVQIDTIFIENEIDLGFDEASRTFHCVLETTVIYRE